MKTPNYNISFGITPTYKTLCGRHVTLKELDIKDIETLYKISHKTTEDKTIWQYMLKGPFDSYNEMAEYYQSLKNKGTLVFTVYSNITNLPVGIVCLMDIQTQHASIELGGIWYEKASQGTKVNTEAVYLLLKYSIGELDFRRVVWKCDNNNEKSKIAALRLGFVFEGMFKHHMIINKNNEIYSRDTAWYGLLKEDWKRIEPRYVDYLTNITPHLYVS